VGRACVGEWELSEEQKVLLDKKMDELQEKYKDDILIQWEEEPGKEHRCGAGFTRWVITSNGNVYPCAIFRLLLGNLAREDPVDILNSPAVWFLQELKAPHDAMCGDCPYFYICAECHGQAFTHYFKVDHCGWVQQFENAPEPLKRAIQEKMVTS
jgi:radical SAM protein with 4Fe4S-binding SPASM domain